jgi:hypothetical protein
VLRARLPYAVAGAVAGTVGKAALDTVTYLDMLVRGRPPSDLPQQAAARVAARVGIDLQGQGRAAHRREGLAAVMGYASGLALGAAYGLLVGRVAPQQPLTSAGLAVGVGAMVGTAVPSTLSGLTDPRHWGVVGWLEDIVPHLAYGFATAVTYRSLASR